MEPWHARPISAVAAELGVDPATGLSSAEVAARLGTHGPNRLEEVGRPGPASIFLRQLASPLVALLGVAAALALLVGERADAFAIVTIVLLNALFGFVQEWKAERELEALRRILSPECSVRRDGRSRKIEAVELVPGDVVLLGEGDRVPADLRIVEAVEPRADESILTGESMPVTKQTDPVPAGESLAGRSSMLWMGTSLGSGRASGIVVATGMATEFGRVAELSGEIGEEATPLQRRLAGVGRQLGLASIAVAAGVALAGWAVGRPAWEMLLTAVSLAVAVVPEGLPAVVTLTLALGVRQLVRRKVLLRRLAAAEAIGAATVLCTDKTGTLTENRMSLRRIRLPRETLSAPFGGHRDEALPLLTSALVACGVVDGSEDAVAERGLDPTEAAIVAAAVAAGVEVGAEILREVPFTSQRRRMTVVTRGPDGVTAHCKGAPEVVLERSSTVAEGEDEVPLDEERRERMAAAYADLAGEGLRVLAIARRGFADGAPEQAEELERDLCLLGFVGLQDPPRPEVPEAVATAMAAGIRLHMVTGDGPGTAAAIAREVGMEVSSSVGEGKIEALDDEQLGERLAEGSVVFSRATPEDKLRIVRLLRARGEIVGMTGDGVNDAPALKQADIGIAMGIRGTDVARAASDLVVTDDNFASIVAAVHEGRRQFDNIRQFIGYLLSSNAGEVVALLINVLTGGPLILLPVQILWMNLLTDGVTALALGSEPAGADVMRRPPHPPAGAMLDRATGSAVLRYGLYIGVATFVAFRLWLGDPATASRAQTMAFTVIILAEIFNVLNFRSSRILDSSGWRANPAMIAALVGTLALHVLSIHAGALQLLLDTVPLTAADWGWAVLLAAPVVLLPRSRPAARSVVRGERT